MHRDELEMKHVFFKTATKRAQKKKSSEIHYLDILSIKEVDTFMGYKIEWMMMEIFTHISFEIRRGRDKQKY